MLNEGIEPDRVPPDNGKKTMMMVGEGKGALSPKRQALRQGVQSPYMAMSMEETAALAGIATSSLYAMVAAHTGPLVTKIGQRSVVLLVDFEAWMKNLRPAQAA